MDKSKKEYLAMQLEVSAGAFRLMSGSDRVEDYEKKMFFFFCNQLTDIAKQLVESCYMKTDK